MIAGTSLVEDIMTRISLIVVIIVTVVVVMIAGMGLVDNTVRLSMLF